MRFVFALVAAWCCAVGLQGAEAKSGGKTIQIGGQQYFSLPEWAETNRLTLVFLKKEEELRLTNRWAKLSFKLNSQKAEVNGVNVFLSYPILAPQGTPCISKKDIERTLRPILFPATNKLKRGISVIALSAGHGGKDSGYHIGGRQEKTYTLLLIQELQALVTQAGLKTVLIRNADQFVELEDRPRAAKRAQADLYVEVHYNCAGPGNTESKGVETYCLTTAGANSTNGGSDGYPALKGNNQDDRNVLLAYQIHRALVNDLDVVDRGIRRARFVVLRDAEMPAVLVEAGFMSQPDDMRRIQDPNHRRQTAQAILDGILAYKRLVERK